MNKNYEPPQNGWLPQHEEFLRKHYATMSMEEMETALGHTKRSIYSKAHLMGLVRRKYKRKNHQNFTIGSARVVREDLGTSGREPPVLNSTSYGPYHFPELAPFAGRPGAMDAFALPSRVGQRRVFRDGRVEETA